MRAATWSGSGIRSAVWALTLPLLAPLALLFLAWSTPQPDVWSHLRQHVLGAALANTVALGVLLALMSGTLGIALAWLVVRCEFPGRPWLEWALVLPLAVPGYVAAFAWVGLTDYAGPLQSGWRALVGTRAAWPDIRSLLGASLVLAVVLYPYVYLLMRAALLRQGAAAFDAARSLGHTPAAAFVRVVLPLTRPAWLAGITLALLETLADFGAVSILGVDTLTTAIYKTWFGLYSLPAAAQLASLLLILVAAVLLLERALRGRGRQDERGARPLPRTALGGWRAVAACAFVASVVVLGFGLPLLQLLGWSISARVELASLLSTAANTLALGAGVAATVATLALVLALAERARPRDPWVHAPVFVANLGYAVPGTVLAVAIMLALLWLEREVLAPAGWKVALSSSLVATTAALSLRFLRVGHASIDAGLRQLRPQLLEAAQALGAGRRERLRRVVLPLLRPSLLAALLLVGVEVMKEMPATLMLRPFGWDTLAVKIHGYTSEGLWAEAAWPALLLIAIGLLPVRWLVRHSIG